MIFDTSRLTVLQRRYFDKVLASYDFEWSSMLPLLKKRSAYYGTPLARIPVEVVDIAASYGACALSWPNGLLQIDDQVAPDAWPDGWTTATGWLWFMQVVMHELGHQAHFFALTRSQETQVCKLLGWDGFNGCGFAVPFGRAFSTYSYGDESMPAGSILKLRRLMGGRGTPPPKIEMTP